MIYFINSRRANTVFETVVSISIIFILIGIFGIYALKMVAVAREVALRNELSNLRLSLELYRMLNKSNPKELKELYSVGDYFVYIARLDKEDRLLDPFRNKYDYNPRTGSIRSTTDKYKNW